MREARRSGLGNLSALAVAFVHYALAYLVAMPIFVLFELVRWLLRRNRRGVGRWIPSR